MAHAKIELIESLSHKGNGRSFKKGQPQTLTSAADIRYYKGQPGFKVTMLASPKPKKPAKTAPPVEEIEEEESEKVKEIRVWDRKELEPKKKAQLREIADNMEVLTENGAKKADIIQAILDAQEEFEEEEEEEEEDEEEEDEEEEE